MAEKNSGYAKYFVWMVLSLLAGLAAIVLPMVFPEAIEELFVTILLVVGIVLLFLALLCLLVGLVEKNKCKKATVEQPSEPEPVKLDSGMGEPYPVAMPNMAASSYATCVPEEKVRYIPSENVYNFIHMGDRQSVEEKFNEISKMDKTQFVIYVARLFSRKGYQVKFTPVLDNFDIDLIVEKMGVTIAVGCILTTKVLCESDIKCIKEGSVRYPVSNVMTLTNMYFDKTAVDFAKRERMSLVDRNILAEDFM